MATVDQLPSTTAERPAIQPVRPSSGLFGVRLWLALMFAAIGTLGGASVYIFVSESSEQAAEDTVLEIIIGRSLTLRENLEDGIAGVGPLTAQNVPERILAESQSESFRTWVVAPNGRLITAGSVFGVEFASLADRRSAVRAALGGDVYRATGLEGDRSVVALPLTDDRESSPRRPGRARRAARRGHLGPPGSSRRAADRARDRRSRRCDHRLSCRQPDHQQGQAPRDGGAGDRRRPPRRRRQPRRA